MTFLEENNIVLSRTQRMKDFVKSWALPVICFVVFWLIFKFVLMTSIIPTQSMYPTLSAPCFTVGVRTDVLNKSYERGDIVLFQRDDGNERIYAKRIVGMPGDVLEIKHGQTYINGVEYEESYLNETPEDLDFGPFQVPEDHYFMMGDNRNNSYDSRYWDEHFVPANKVMSKVYLYFHLGLSDKDSQDDMAAQKGEN